MSKQLTSKTLPELVRELAKSYPDREAIVDGDRRVTFRDLHHAVENCARGLMSIGAGPRDKIAILMGNRLEWVVTSLAATYIGGVAVALNTWYTPREIAHAMNHSDARYLVCTPNYMKHDYVQALERLRAEGRLPLLQAVVGVGQSLPPSWYEWDALCTTGASSQAGFDGMEPSAEDVAFILYTSGSTSQPKGVQLVHRGLIENIWNIGERQQVSEHDRLWLAVSLFWGFGCSNAMLNLLMHGGCLVLQDSFDAPVALSLLDTERCTMVYGTPNMIQALVDHPNRDRHDLSSLRTGATLGTPEQVRRAVTLGAAGICHIYGLTETYGNCHVTDASDPLELRLRSCGKPLPGVAQRIADPQTGREVAIGEVGEICVKGYVTKGYYKDPEQTALAFDGDGFFRTGDLGCVDANGNLYFHGRIKELVKTGGINVSPAEIESVLMTHPDVHLAIVVGVPHPTRDEVLGAVIVPKRGRLPTEDELQDFCRGQLAIYKVPAAFAFCAEEALPLTTTGKIQKNRIAATFFAGSKETA